MNLDGKYEDKVGGASALDRCGIYALRKDSEAAYRTFFACGGTPARIAQLVAQLKKDRVALVEPDPAQLNACQDLKDRDIEDLLLTDRKEKELTAIVDAYLDSHPTIQKVIDLYQRLVEKNPENKKNLSAHFEELLWKKLSQSDLQTTLKILKEKKLLHEIATQAIAKKHQALCKLIVSEIDPADENLFPLAMHAIQTRNLEALKLILELCPKLKNARNLFEVACETCNLEACQFLLERVKMLPLMTGLRLVLANSKTEESVNLKLIDLLLSYGSTLFDKKQLDGSSKLLQYAVERASSCNEFDADNLDGEGKSKLHLAVINRDTAKIKQILEGSGPINFRDRQGLTPLHHAAASGNREAIELLTAKGASLHVCDNLGRQPLDHAILANNCEAIQCLVDAGADCEEKNGNGNTRLAQALLSDSVEPATLKFLVEKCGADIDATCGVDPMNENGRGIPILSRAAYYYKHLKYLLDRGAEVNPGQASTLDSFVKCCSNDFEKPNFFAALVELLTYGARSNSSHSLPTELLEFAQYKLHSVDQAKLLIRPKINDHYAEEIARSGTTPLHQACAENNEQKIADATSIGAPVNCRDSEGATPLHVLLKSRPQDTKAVARLLRSGASVLAQDHQGMTALHIAAREGLNDEINNLLLQANPEVINKQDNLGRTPLHWAAIKGNEEVIKVLLKNNASVTIPDKQDLLPYHLLTKYFPQVAENLYGQFNPIPGVGFKLWQQLCAFYLLEKLLCHRFGIDSSYMTAAGERVKLQGFFSEITLEELAKSAEKDRVYAQFVPLLRQANAMLNASKQSKQALTREVKQAFESKIVPVSTGWLGHATGMVVSPGKKILLKVNRGEAIEPDQSGLRVFTVQKPAQTETEVEKSLLLKNQKEGRPHFQSGVDAALGLKEIPDLHLPHKEQKVGNCTWVSGKLLLRGADYLSHLDSTTHAGAASESRVQYKQFVKKDRLDALKEFLAAAKAIDAEVLPHFANHTVLAQNGIIPQQILRELMFKSIRKQRTDCLQLILEAYPALLASTQNGHSVLECAKGNPEALAIIRQCYKNNRNVLFPLCVESNIADGLEFLLKEFPELIEGEQGLNALQKAFSKGHKEAVALLETALRSLKLNQCLTTGLRVFDCSDNNEAMCLNRNALKIFIMGGKTISDFMETVNRLKAQKRGAHLATLPQSELEKAFESVRANGPTEDELIDYLLKNPMEIRKSKHYLLKAQQAVKPATTSQVEKLKEVPEHHYHMQDAFLQIAGSNSMLKLIDRYSKLQQDERSLQIQNRLMDNLILLIERRIKYKKYDTGSLEHEIKTLAAAIAQVPRLKNALLNKIIDSEERFMCQLYACLQNG